MTKAFDQIVEFNRDIIGIAPRPLGMMDQNEADFTVTALHEEVREFETAQATGNIIGCIDALLDGIYFAVGGLYKMGLTPEQMSKCMTAVHEANMTKKKGVTNRGHENDAIKPTGWVSPEERIGNILDGKQ
jgi:predicted HAD superfamily Cof-like phosphohydrolase